MNKKLFLIGLMLTTFAGSLLAEVEVFTFSDSARKRATAGIYASESDYLGASDIFSITRTIFSAGYVPSLTEGGKYNDVGTMSGFWAMPINKTVTIGFSGEYQMNSTKTDYAAESKADVFGGTFDGVDTDGLASQGIHAVYRREHSTEKSAFNLRPVLRWGNFAFHYRLSRDSAAREVLSESITGVDDGAKLYDYAYTISNPNWQHEIGFAYNASKFIVYVPLGFDVQMNGTSSTKTTNATTTPNTHNSSTTKNQITYMYINPEFTMPMTVGRLSQIKVGLDTTFQIYNGHGATVSTNYDGSQTTTETTTYEGQGYGYFNLYFTPTFDWKLWNNKADFTVEPTVGLKFAHRDYGTYIPDAYTAENAYYNRVVPYVKAAIATLIRPVAWFEFRTGISYGMEWDNTIVTQQHETDNYSYNSSSYTFSSAFNIYTGMGFKVGDDFSIDIYVQAGQDAQLALGDTTGTTKTTSLFDINAYGAQLTYRF